LSADPSSEVVTSRRPAQVAAVLHRALQQRLARGLSDPRLQGLVSILDVHVTPDLSHARVRVSVLPADRGPLSLSALRSAAGHLRASVRDSVHLRRVPELSFELAVPREETPE
jgi:ribosome-binding factor A